MRKLVSFALSVLVSTLITAQTNTFEVDLQSGKYGLTPTANKSILASTVQSWPRFNEQSFGIVRLEMYPTQDAWDSLALTGITNISYVPNRSFIVSITSGADLTKLNAYGVVAQSGFQSDFKGSSLNQAPPARAIDGSDVIANLHIFSTVDWGPVRTIIVNEGGVILDTEEALGYVTVSCQQSVLSALAHQPFVQFIDWKYDAGMPENYTSRTLSRTNYLSPDNSNGIGYDGSGIIVALQDDGSIDNHLDHHGRILEQFWTASLGDHGDHVGGTINGAGNLNPYHEGHAKGSDMYVYKAAPQYQAFDSMNIHYNSRNVVITSTSYSNGCNAGYTALARQMDQQVHDFESLIHVFSAGNSGTSNCGYGAGNTWGNITGGHKVGKNVMTVANLDHEDNLATSSSRGPAHDGRIKPDISAKGTQVTSTVEGNQYGVKSGTSMSCPAVSGTLAVLYEAFEDQQGNLPPSGLLKAIALNTAEDLGNAGPDFRYGWGRINARQAFEVIESSSFTEGTLADGDSTQFTLIVPSNTSRARFMLYWTDPEATVNASTALINDLDLTITDPSSNVNLPYVLDHTPNATTLNNPAVPGEDHLNNMEQVEFLNPASGNYLVKVKGHNVPQGPQKFYLVYWFESDDLTLSYPVGGESFVPFNTEKIRWEAPGAGALDSALIEYSPNGGASWFTVAANAPLSIGYYDWIIPSIASGNVQVRMTFNSEVVTSDDLSIIRTPTGLTVDYACPDSIGLSWNNTSGATGFTVHRLGQKYMEELGTSNTIEFVDYNSNPYSENLWYSVSSLGENDAVGKRAVAIQHPPGVFNCFIGDDAGLVAVSPSSGSVFSCHGDSINITFEVENFGSNPITSLDAEVNTSSGQSISESFTVNIAPNSTQEIAFTGLIGIGSTQKEVELVIDIPNDGNSFNDTLVATYIPTVAPSLDAIWSEDFETFNNCSEEANCGDTDCPLSNNWVNEQNYLADDHDWRTHSGSTFSQFTGPTTDHTTGNTSGKYLYTEASGGCSILSAYLTSPCIDLTQAEEPTLTFWYHMNGADIGELHLDVFDGNTWTKEVFSVFGNQGGNWQEAVVPLNEFGGKLINLRFRGQTGADFRSDIAIDDLGITAPPVANFSYEIQNDDSTVAFTDLSSLADTMMFDLGDSSAILDSVPALYTYPETISYEVVQIVSNDYGSDTATQIIATLNTDLVKPNSTVVFPNPAQTTLFVQSTQYGAKFDVYAIDGSLVHTNRIASNGKAKVPVEAFENGLYLLRFENGKTIEFTVIK